MELRHLRFFLALAEELDVARAAKHCGLTPPVLNRHIEDLEDSLGCSLFRRNGNKVSLSATGQVFLTRAQSLLVLEKDATLDPKDARALIRVGHYGSWWQKRYAEGLKRFSKKCPDLCLQPHEFLPADIAGCLRRGDLDMAFLEHVDIGLRIEFNVKRIEVLSPVALVGVTHPLAKKRRISFKELGESAWVVWDERVYPGRRHMFIEAAQRAGLLPCIAWDAENEAAVFEQVGNCSTVGYAPAVIEAPSETMRMIDLKASHIEFPVFLAWRKDAENLEELDFLAECIVRAASK